MYCIIYKLDNVSICLTFIQVLEYIYAYLKLKDINISYTKLKDMFIYYVMYLFNSYFGHKNCSF